MVTCRTFDNSVRIVVGWLSSFDSSGMSCDSNGWSCHCGDHVMIV